MTQTTDMAVWQGVREDLQDLIQQPNVRHPDIRAALEQHPSAISGYVWASFVRRLLLEINGPTPPPAPEPDGD